MTKHVTNIGRESSSFFGRHAELRELAGRIAAGERLVTLTGGPGSGKTRLARRFALGELERYAEVWFCDLATVGTSDDLADRIAALLEVEPERRSSTAEDRVGRALARRGRVLLVLDNLEQLAPHAVGPISGWLAMASGTQIVATSRQPLELAGESCIEVPALDYENAVALFLARAAQLSAFPIGDHHLDVVREIVRTLDGLPLAIELAADRIVVLDPPTLLERLSERFRVLRTRRADVSERQATLWGAIDWSWTLLGPDEQEVLRRC